MSNADASTTEMRAMREGSMTLVFMRTKTYKEDKVRTSGDIVQSVEDREGSLHPYGESNELREVSPGVLAFTGTNESRTGSMTKVVTRTTIRVERTACPVIIHVDTVYDYQLGERTDFQRKSRKIVIQAGEV